MTFETWLAFALASAVVVLIPGPNVALTVNYAIQHGKRSGLATIPGVMAGAFLAMSLSLAGAGAILAASSTLFSLFKLVGTFYLIWLAYKLWTAPVALSSPGTPAKHPIRMLFWQSFMVSALNPKGPVFYMAFVPQFVNTAEPIAAQFMILITTFVCVAGLNGGLWLLLADGMRARLENPKALRLLNRLGASCLFVAGVLTSKVSRAT